MLVSHPKFLWFREFHSLMPHKLWVTAIAGLIIRTKNPDTKWPYRPWNYQLVLLTKIFKIIVIMRKNLKLLSKESSECSTGIHNAITPLIPLAPASPPMIYNGIHRFTVNCSQGCLPKYETEWPYHFQRRFNAIASQIKKVPYKNKEL